MQRAGGAEFLRGFGEFDGLGGGVRAGAGDHLAAAGGVFDGQADHLDVFVRIERRRLAGGADRHDAIHPAGDLAFDEGLEGGGVHRSIAKRGDQCGVSAGKAHGAASMTHPRRRSKPE